MARNDSPVMGRPTKYREEMPDEIRAMGPMTVTKLALALGVAIDTMYAWMNKYPDFSDAVKESRAGVVMRLEDAMIGQAEGTVTGNATAGIFLLKNLAPKEYRDRREVQVESQSLEINFVGFDEDAIEGDFEELDD